MSKRKVYLLCWNEWDYDLHEEPREAYLTRGQATKALKSKPEGAYRHKEGWSIMEVDLILRKKRGGPYRRMGR